jgi:hypothetical protein
VDLKLEIASPKNNAVATSDPIAVIGVTSPDAVISLNGQLLTPDTDGRFSTLLPITWPENSRPIEVIATSVSGEQRSAVITVDQRSHSIRVNAGRPVQTLHIMGVVTSHGDNEMLSIVDERGNQISAALAANVTAPPPGELVTALLTRDLRTGALRITGLNHAVSSIGRIQAALEHAEQAEATADLNALKVRLGNKSTRHLTLLREAGQRASPVLRPHIDAAVQTAANLYSPILSHFNVGIVEVESSGLISAIDTQNGRITISPAGTKRTSPLPPVELSITANTIILLQGQEITADKLQEFWRVTARYSLDTQTASRVQVLLGEALEQDLAHRLLRMVDHGEATGTVVNVDLSPASPTVDIHDTASEKTLALTVSERSIMRENGSSVDLRSMRLNSLISVSFKEESREIIELETRSIDDRRQRGVSGVAYSFVTKKAMPGNFSILTTTGEILTLNHNERTVIRRDGRQVSINEVRLGDLVRPNTRYLSDTKDIVLLSLKSPNLDTIQGTIGGIITRSNGQTWITVITAELNLVKILATEDTHLTRQGAAIGFADLAAGQQVTGGTYDPISLKAVHLDLGPRSVAITKAPAAYSAMMPWLP